MREPTFLFTADLHLTSRTRDEYRWEIFDWLKKQISRREVDVLFILGDLADQKDGHPATLVNRLIDALVKIADMVPIHMVMGNHDYIDSDCPFFDLLNSIPNMCFITSPDKRVICGKKVLSLPHIRNWRQGWWLNDKRALESGFDFVLMHQTIHGSMVTPRHVLDGVPEGTFSDSKVGKCVISGDIHVPQVVGCVAYCGSPYPINFGDEFEPRVLLHKGGKLKSLKRLSIRKPILYISDIEHLMEEELEEGDQIKVVYELPRIDFPSWDERRQEVVSWASKNGVVIMGLELRELGMIARDSDGKPIEEKEEEGRKSGTPGQVLNRYCETKEVEEDLEEVGIAILGEE